jgi:hypothetical protein
MTAKAFIDVLGKTGYSPRTLNLEVQDHDLFASLSIPAKAFLFLTMNLKENERISVGQLYGKRWADDSDVIGHFRELSEDVRIEVLAFVTLMLHEITHHVDFLSTPFGLHFHLKTIREYWSLQYFAPILLENPELIPERFVDFGSHYDRVTSSQAGTAGVAWYPLRGGDGEQLRNAWHALEEQIRTLEAWGDGSAVQPHRRHIEKGWAGRTDTLRLFGRELQPVTVHGFLASVSLPGFLSWYLRPLTLFETRAVAHSMQWVLHLVGDDAADVLPSYFAALYRRKGLPPDYFFLFDLLASASGFASFEEFLAKGSPNARQNFLSALSFACWYALQAPPPMDQDAILTSNPIIRLLVILRAYDDLLVESKPPCNSFGDLANSLDELPRSRESGCRPINEILKFCRQTIDASLDMNRMQTWNPKVANHFSYILQLLGIQLTRRDDYNSLIGMPTHGNPLFCFADPEDQKLLDPYEAPEDVVSWFGFRTNLLFRFTAQSKIVERMEQHFGMNELSVPCGCGTIISGRISKWMRRAQATCPNCARVHDIDLAEAVRFRI